MEKLNISFCAFIVMSDLFRNREVNKKEWKKECKSENTYARGAYKGMRRSIEWKAVVSALAPVRIA